MLDVGRMESYVEFMVSISSCFASDSHLLYGPRSIGSFPTPFVRDC